VSPGGIHEQLVAADIGLAHGDQELGFPAAVEFAEARVAIALRLTLDVLVPQDRQLTCLRFSSLWMAAQSGSIWRRWPCFVPALANSLASSVASVISSGSGQLRPAAWKRLSVARTVDAATPIRRLGDRPDDDVAIRHHSDQLTILVTDSQRTDVLVSDRSCRFAARCTRFYHLNPLRHYLVCTLSLCLPSCSAIHVHPYAWRPMKPGQGDNVLGPAAEADAPGGDAEALACSI
jgi:hypothetical protein